MLVESEEKMMRGSLAVETVVRRIAGKFLVRKGKEARILYPLNQIILVVA